MRTSLVGLLAMAVALGAAGCGSGGGTAKTATGHVTPPAATESDDQTVAVVLSAPAAGDTLRATRAVDGRLHATLNVRGTAVRDQTLRVQLSCPDRSCSRFVLTDDRGGAFGARMDVILPATLSRLTVSVNYATIPDPTTAATVKVSVHRPRIRRHRGGGTAAQHTTTVPAPETATVPQQQVPESTTTLTPSAGTTPAGARRTMTVIGDSLAVGMQPYLGTVLPGWRVTVNGRVGRPLGEGMAILRAATLPSADSSVLAISLFTNDDPRDTAQLSSAIDATLRAVGSSGCVIWATISRDPVGGVSYEAANALLQRKAAATPALRIADWSGYVIAHPGTLSAGNVHPGPAGYRARAALYAQAAAGCP